MPGPDGPWGAALVAAVEAGRVPEAQIDDKVARLLRLAELCGALDPAPHPRRLGRARTPTGSRCAGPRRARSPCCATSAGRCRCSSRRRGGRTGAERAEIGGWR